MRKSAKRTKSLERLGTSGVICFDLILSDVIKFKCPLYTSFDTGRLDYSVWDVGAESLSEAVAWLRDSLC